MRIQHSASSATDNWQLLIYAGSSIGRAAVSKAAGWGFDSLLACWLRGDEVDMASMY